MKIELFYDDEDEWHDDEDEWHDDGVRAVSLRRL